jgi:hypothetical protein
MYDSAKVIGNCRLQDWRCEGRLTSTSEIMLHRSFQVVLKSNPSFPLPSNRAIQRRSLCIAMTHHVSLLKISRPLHPSAVPVLS